MELEQEEHYLKRELYQRLRGDPELFEFLEKGSTDGLWYWDIENPDQEWMSPSFKALFGYADHEIPNTSQWWQANIHPEDLKVSLHNLEEHLKDPAHPYDQVVRYRHRNGDTVWVRCRGLAIRNVDGKPTRLLGVHIDETALHQQLTYNAELNNVLVESHNKLAMREVSSKRREAEVSVDSLNVMFALSPIGKAVLGPGGVIQFGNAALAKLFGYTLEELKGLPISHLLPRNIEFRHINSETGLPDLGRYAEGAEAGGQMRLDAEGLAKDGRSLSVSLVVMNLPVEGRVDVLVTVVDMTWRHHSEIKIKRYGESLRRAQGELANFSRAAAHDLQTPLRGVRNLATWLEEDLDSGDLPSARLHLERLTSQVMRMQRLIDGLLRYSSADSFNVRAVRVDLARLIEADWDLLEPPPSMVLNLPDSFPPLVTAATPLRQCLRNLLENAIKHHDREDGVVSVSCRDEGDFLRIEVKDDGPGVPQEYQSLVFNFLKTLRPHRDLDGPGLGLALVSKIVGRLGGRVGLRSKVGEGCTFWFTWPKNMPSLDAQL